MRFKDLEFRAAQMPGKTLSRHIFHQVGLFCDTALLPFFKHSQMIYAGYVNVAKGKSQTCRVKFNILPKAREVTFSLVEGKNYIGLGFTGSVTEARDN